MINFNKNDEDKVQIKPSISFAKGVVEAMVRALIGETGERIGAGFGARPMLIIPGDGKGKRRHKRYMRDHQTRTATHRRR
jgi:hypothetical protein